MSSPTSTRQRTNAASGTDLLNNDLPKRRGKALKPVSKPFNNISLNTMIYWLAAISLIFAGFYTYRITQWKADAGGWWNLALGKRPPQMQAGGASPSAGVRGGSTRSTKLDLEDHINGIASILGVEATELASAISGVVSEHVAPKSLSSLSSSASAAKAEKTAVGALVGDEDVNDAGGPSLGSVAKAVDAVVGFDVPIGADEM